MLAKIFLLIPATWVIVGMLVAWFLASVIEAARWKRHVKRFLPQEAAEQIERLTEERRKLKADLKQAEADRDHMALQIRAISGALEI